MNLFGKKNDDTTQEDEAPQKLFTIDTLMDMDQVEFDLLAFSFSGKVAGRISSFSMSIAGTQTRLAKHLKDSDQPSIDKFNDSLAELDEIEAQNDFFEKAGIEQPADKEAELKAWLGVRQIMVERGFVPAPLSENFKWMIEQTIKRNSPSEAELKTLAEASGIKEEDITKIYKAKADRAISDTVEVSKSAMRLINDLEPDTSTNPVGFHEIFESAIDTSKKTAMIRGNNIEESLASLALLNVLEA